MASNKINKRYKGIKMSKYNNIEIEIKRNFLKKKDIADLLNREFWNISNPYSKFSDKLSGRIMWTRNEVSFLCKYFKKSGKWLFKEFKNAN